MSEEFIAAEPVQSSRIYMNGLVNELTLVQLDHSYAKPWNWRQESAHCRPVRTLFSEGNISTLNNNVEVDVESVAPEKIKTMLRTGSNERLFVESEFRLHSPVSAEATEDWEDNVKRDGWTPLHHRVFNKVAKLLVSDKLATLATEKCEAELIQKKNLRESSAKKLRVVLSSVSWDPKLTHWLHLTLLENLSADYLTCYVGILQVLRSKLPSLVDQMLSTALINNKLAALNTQVMNFVLDKPWEPVLMSNPLVPKLNVVPLIVLVPSGDAGFNIPPRGSVGSRRFQTWQHLLGNLGHVVMVSLHSTPPHHTLRIPLFVETVIGATVQKVQELKANCPGRPIILAGLQQGALIAAQVAYMEPVTALLCLGFPLFCVDGKRGEPDDFILEVRSPTMIVVGQCSSTCTIDGIEQLRHRMKAESSLLVVEGATDSLRMLRMKKRQQNVTQSMVDSLILEEIGTFTATIVHQAQFAEKRSANNVDRKMDLAGLTGSAAKRQRASMDNEDFHSTISGHSYSQSNTFAQPWHGKTRGGTGLSRVRGGRAGPNQRSQNHKGALSEFSSTKGRVSRLVGLGVNQAANRLATSNDFLPKTPTIRQTPCMMTSPAHLETDGETKSNASSTHGSPKEENTSNVASSTECKGGDSSETESAPPADDDEENIEEDLRFCNELLNKLQNHSSEQTPDNENVQKRESSDFSLQFSADEDDLPLAEVSRRLNAENRNRQKDSEPQNS